MQEREHSPIDITSHDFWSQPFAVRDETFAQLRAGEGLMEDFENRIGPAVEEFVRWSSPVLQFARFVTEDTEINGHPVSAGDKVGLFYCSANQDESVFDEPGQFKLQRSPNPHLGFGGGGPHFCLGNQPAKTELRNLFRELLTRLKTVEFGEPDLLYSSFVHGVKRLPAFVQ